MELDTDSDYVLGLDKKFKPRTVKTDNLLSEFIKETKKNKESVILWGNNGQRNARKFAVSFITVFEVAKNL